MGSRPRSSITKEMRRTRRNVYGKAQRKSSSSRTKAASSSSSSSPMKVSEKLVALNNLINPMQNNNEEVKTDKLFQETANYIVLLKTQVSILQKLVDFYGSNSATHDEQVQENQNNVVV